MIKSISPKEAKTLIDSKSSIKIIDVREEWEHNLAKLEKSLLIPIREFPRQLAKFELEGTYLIYCHYGSRSFFACAVMAQKGFKDVYNLEGGIDAWARTVDRSIPKY